VTRFMLLLVEWSGRLPLSWVRALGAAFGMALFVFVPSRRRVVRTNLELCFPQWSAADIARHTRQTFIFFAQAWLDRGWMWFSAPDVTLKRIRLVGAVQELDGDAPTLIFTPHFVGMDAGWVALTQQVQRKFTTIYAAQANKAVDEWILKGRKRFGTGRPFDRLEGLKPALAALRAGEPMCLLTDMNYEPLDSVFVPFYGITAATVPSLSRVARMGRAKVIAMVARITPEGYEIEITPAWPDFPTQDLVADTAHMNQRLEGYINASPAQYYWVHKRFKDRPDGLPAPY
jgi:KDO2-lipid IV(A) lauroyltransferase